MRLLYKLSVFSFLLGCAQDGSSLKGGDEPDAATIDNSKWDAAPIDVREPDAAVVPDDPPFTGQIGAILFVTQVPHDGFSTIASTFGNHPAAVSSVPRGGDLMLRYADGTLRNLTREAGFGMQGMQGANAIAVREPSVHWSGNKAIFSMVVGSPAERYQTKQYRWQLYEVTGLARGETAVITKVKNQPDAYNNVAPTYAPDDQILFTTDRPRGGEAHLYPQRDEYESSPSNSGLWRLAPDSGALTLLTHAPSGVFSPSVDSAGRVIFVKWDHLQRDQQADADRQGGTHGSFSFADESAGAQKSARLDIETFPEPRDENDPAAKPNLRLHGFNQFIPWEINLDGTAEETLNHIGRHEIGGTYSEGSFADDPNLTFLVPQDTHLNRSTIRGDGGLFHLREDPTTPGRFYATYAREFGTAGGGMLLRFNGGLGVNPEVTVLEPLTSPDGINGPDSAGGAPDSDGHYRNPLPLADGTLIASHSADVRGSRNSGTTTAPAWNYAYRLRVVEEQGDVWKAGAPLTAGIKATVSWWSPDVMINWSGDLWELDAVEVRPRERPTPRTSAIPAPEQGIFSAEGIDLAKLRGWLRQNELALVVSRNVTYRDRADVFQPYNLRVPGGVMTAPKGGKIYDISHLQFFQADAIRGYGGMSSPNPGRRNLAMPMHNANSGPTPAGAPAGAVAIAADGSTAAFVPARRAMTWQLTAPDGSGVVRERNWVTFAPGEIRVCASCHGVNTKNQAGAPDATNPPEALRQLMKSWKAANP